MCLLERKTEGRVKVLGTMDKLLTLCSNLRKSCLSERKRSKEAISCSGDEKSLWPLRYVPCQQWGKTTFNHDETSVLRNAHEKCGKHKFLRMLSNGLARKRYSAEHGEVVASNVMLISLRHNVFIQTNPTGVGSTYRQPISSDGRTRVSDINRERGSGAGNCAQKHILPTRRVRQRSRKATERRRLGLVEDVRCPGRSGAEPLVKHHGHNTALCQRRGPKNNLVYILGNLIQ